MKHISLFMLALMLPGLMMAQKLSPDFEVSVSKPFAVIDAKDKQYFSMGDGTSISVKTRGEIVTVQLFDTESMNELSRKVYEDFPKYNKVQQILKAGDKLFYVSEAYNKKEKTFSVYAREISSDGKFSGIKKLFTTKRAVGAVKAAFGEAGAFSFGMGGKKFEVSSSFDGSKILIQYRLKPAKKKDKINKDEIGFHVFDAELEHIWGSVETMPYTEKVINNIAYTVTSDGKARMLVLKREEKKYELITVDENGLTTAPLEIPGEVTFQKLQLRENDEGNIICAGFYANGIIYKAAVRGPITTGYSTDGYVVFNISPKSEVLDYRFGEFPLDFIKLNQSARDKKKADKKEKKDVAGINGLALVEFHVEKDGSLLLVGERQFLTTEYKYVGGKMKTILVANFTNVVLVKLSPDGELAWMKKIAKQQKPMSAFSTRSKIVRGGMGIKYIRNADSHYILYLDNIKNNEIPLDKAPYRHLDGMGGFLVAVKIDDQTGAMERHPILDVRTEIEGIKVHQFKTTRLFDVDDNSMMLETYIKGKEDAMIRLDLVQ
jgi:hypothetical protein